MSHRQVISKSFIKKFNKAFAPTKAARKYKKLFKGIAGGATWIELTTNLLEPKNETETQNPESSPSVQ
jgi:hypothetical protein